MSTILFKEVTPNTNVTNTAPKRYQFYKAVTSVDPVTGESVTINQADGIPMTATDLQSRIDNLTAQLALQNARMSAINAQ